MKRFPIVLVAFSVALVGPASIALAGCVQATGFRDFVAVGDLCVSPTYPGVQAADPNGDNFGTRCDGDYSTLVPVFIPQDCSTDIKRDYPIFVRAFRAGVGADQDHDGNGVVNANDFGLFVGLLGKTPD